MKTRIVVSLCVFLFGIFAPFFDVDATPVPTSQKMEDADVQFLLDGVEGIPAIGAPGPLCVFGDNAKPIVAGKQGKSLAPVVAALKYEKGRVVAFGHDGYVTRDMFTKTPDCKRFVKNALDWTGNNRESVRIAVIGDRGIADDLRETGCDVLFLPNLDDPDALENNQIIVTQVRFIHENHLPRLTQFIADGGGLITASLGWGWLQISGKTNLKTEHTGNLLCAPMGIVWTDGSLQTTIHKDGMGLYGTKITSPLMTLDAALEAVLEHEKGEATLKPEEVATAITAVELAIRTIPDSQASKLARLTPFAEREVIPGGENKIRKDSMISDVIAITLQTERYLKSQSGNGLPEGGVPALKAADSFPGGVSADAKTVTKNVDVDTAIPEWHSTGLYAAPGQTITVRIPDEFVSDDKRRCLKARIGCHIDLTWHHGEWTRYPEITLEVPLLGEETKLANPFGGLFYIVVPRNFDKGTAQVGVSGCVEAPLYVHGKTSLDDWKKTIRSAPGPWGELASDRIILSMPSKQLRELDDPDAVMEFWNNVLDRCAELSARPIKRERPERFTCDRQLSAGYMHNGYPLMSHMDVEEFFVTLKDNPEKGWGFFHEIGHQFQAPYDWTFDGSGEVTVNLFTLYVFDKVFQWDTNHVYPHIFSVEKERVKRDAYFAKGAPFDTWKRDPFLALLMYVELQQEFGWDAFIKTFQEYRDLPNGERPKNDDQKRDQWMVRFSKTVGKNLGPFFQTWGVPVSQGALDSIKDLPLWEPVRE